MSKDSIVIKSEIAKVEQVPRGSNVISTIISISNRSNTFTNVIQFELQLTDVILIFSHGYKCQ